jgi:lipopolysaccharide transport system permease protein
MPHRDLHVEATTIAGSEEGRSTWSLRPKELWRYRELLYFLIWRDIKVRYQQTVLGIAWTLIQPLAIALSLTLFLGRTVHVPQGGLPYPIFAYSAMLIWQLFAQALLNSSNSLLDNERLITKVYFPRLLIPLSASLCTLLDFAIGSIILIPYLIYYGVAPHAGMLFLPVPVFLAVLLASGAGLWLGSLNVRYRDVRYTLAFIVQFWFLASPVAYPVTVVPEKWRALYALNPMVGVVEGFRWALRGSGYSPAHLIAISAAVAIVCFVSGLYYFRHMEETFADFI